MDPIRLVVVDDDAAARAGVLALLEGDPELRVVGECATGMEAVSAIQRLQPELLLLDIQLPELDGFQVLDALDGVRPAAIVFMTGRDEFAVRAFEARAVDYLLKPFTDARFAEAMAQAKERVQQQRIGALGRELASLVQRIPGGEPPGGRAGPNGRPAPDEADAPPYHYPDRIVVRHGRETLLIALDDLDWIGAADYYVRLHVGADTYLVRETMQQMEERLDPRRFVRIHRSTIVNVARVSLIQPHARGSHLVHLHDGTRLVMSRGRREALEEVLGQPI